jgi:hypothetical protein
MTETETSPKKAYRLLTGPDDAAFCQRVSDALRDGYALYGHPAMTERSDGQIWVAQAVVLKNL